MELVYLKDGSYFNRNDFKGLEILSSAKSIGSLNVHPDRIRIDYGVRSKVIEFDSPEQARDYADGLKVQILGGDAKKVNVNNEEGKEDE
jgi:hypothetical protein